MLLIAMAMAAVTALADPAGDGAFVGNVVAVDATSLVVRAQDGDDVTFLIDGRTDMPAGFVKGTRVVVRFETVEDKRYRAVSVSPPRLPLEADVATEMPPLPGPAPVPPSAPHPRRTEDRPLPTPSVDAGPPVAPRVNSPSAGVVATPLEYPPPALPPTVSTLNTPAAPLATPARQPPPRFPTARLVAVMLLLTATALLTWAFLRSR